MRAPIAEVENAECVVCGSQSLYRWTDTHGIGACLTCGCPYRLFHYEKDGEGKDRRVERQPECCILPDWLDLARRYWEEEHRNCDPGAYNFSGSSYEVATQEDVDTYQEWMEAHRDEFPATQEATP